MKPSKTMTFSERYFAIEQHRSPRAEWVTKIAKLTRRSEISVRKWIAGDVIPSIEIQEKLAKHFDAPVESLFPNKKK